MSNEYAERDAAALDKAGGYYMRHVMAITHEGLDSKSDIAAELAFRDMQIDQFKQRVNQLLTERNSTGLAIDNALCGVLPEQHGLLSRLTMLSIIAAQRDEFLRDMQDVLDMLINQPHAVTAANQAEDMLRLSIATASSRVKGGAS